MSKKFVAVTLVLMLWVGFSGTLFGEDLEALLRKAEKDAKVAKEASLKALSEAKAKKAEEEMNMYVSESMTALKAAMKNPNKKDDFTEQIKFQMNLASITSFNCGSKFYNEKKYEEAAESFKESVKS